MSVVIRKREEKRNTPFYTFLAAAAVPLLLMLLGGIFLGRTQDEDANYWKNKYELAQNQADSLQNREIFITQLVQQSDSLREAFEEGLDKLNEDLSNVYPHGDEYSWISNKARYIKEWKRKIGELEGEKIMGSPMRKIAITQIDLLDEYIDSRSQWLDQRQLTKMKDVQLSDEEVINMQIQQLESDIKRLEAENQQLNVQVLIEQQKALLYQQNSSGNNTDLIDKLSKAKEKLITHQQLATQMTTHIQDIRSGIIPQMDVSLINLNRDRMERLRESLKGKVASINEICLQIAN